MVEITSNTKKLLLFIASLMLVLSTVQFIYSVAHDDGEQISWSIFNLTVDLCFVAVIFKQWQLGLRIYSIILQAFVVISVIALIFCVYIISFGDDGLRQDIGEKTASVVAGLLLYSLLAYLVRRYIRQVDYNEGYTIT